MTTLSSKKQSATVGGKSDIVMTPDPLAYQVVGHFLLKYLDAF
jgi:hypothetical protein